MNSEYMYVRTYATSYFPNFIITTDASRLYCSRLLSLCTLYGVQALLHLHICTLSFSFSLSLSYIIFFFFSYFCAIFSHFFPGTIETGNFTWQPVIFIICFLFLFFILLLLLRFHSFAPPCGGIALLLTSDMNENQSISLCDMI